MSAMNNPKKNFRKPIILKIVSKKIKYVRIKLTKEEEDWYTNTCLTTLEWVKEDQNK